MSSTCKSYCSHGGICILEGKHKKHDSGYCKWTDKEAITKEKADELLIIKGRQTGTSFLAEFLARNT